MELIPFGTLNSSLDNKSILTIQIFYFLIFSLYLIFWIINYFKQNIKYKQKLNKTKQNKTKQNKTKQNNFLFF